LKEGQKERTVVQNRHVNGGGRRSHGNKGNELNSQENRPIRNKEITKASGGVPLSHKRAKRLRWEHKGAVMWTVNRWRNRRRLVDSFGMHHVREWGGVWVKKRNPFSHCADHEKENEKKFKVHRGPIQRKKARIGNKGRREKKEKQRIVGKKNLRHKRRIKLRKSLYLLRERTSKYEESVKKAASWAGFG